MTLKPSTSGLPLLLGDDTSEMIALSPGQLKNYPYGVVALGGNDSIVGSSDGDWGNDAILGGSDRDLIVGNQGNDVINGNQGSDFIFGDASEKVNYDYSFPQEQEPNSELLYGGQGNDILLGSEGSDTLSGDLGQDFLVGDGFLADGLPLSFAGRDVFVLKQESAANQIEDADFILDFDGVFGYDRIGLAGGLTADDIVLEKRSSKSRSSLRFLKSLKVMLRPSS